PLPMSLVEFHYLRHHFILWHRRMPRNYAPQQRARSGRDKEMKRLIQLCILLLLAAPAAAQQFPGKPINMIVVFAPGGATDVLARIAADHMSRTLGQRVIVENVTGAGGTIGGARGAQAAPDGYTLTVGSMGSHSAAPTIYASSIKYNPLELEPIGVIGGT